MQGRVFRNYYKGHMDKTKGQGGSRGGRWVCLRWGRSEGEMQTTVIEQQKNNLKNIEKKTIHKSINSDILNTFNKR